jgi:hypothetical protein
MFYACNKCKLKKPDTEFYQHKTNPHGLHYTCKVCMRSRAKELRDQKPKGYLRDRYAERQKEWRKNNPSRVLKSRLKNYGLTPEQYFAMLVDQKFVCKICQRPERVRNKDNQIKPLAVDHCHKTGKVRGLLCQACNHAIGELNDDPQLCLRAAQYLEARK